ncbi:MAG: 4Fe-4S binding protein [Marinilabiliales bacterium]|nr:4Fe-4S binding protein [Marinilabiliales bacterium]
MTATSTASCSGSRTRCRSGRRRIRGSKIKPRRDQSSPAIVRELSKCILCGRCLRVCEEVVTATSIDFIGRGRYTHVGPAMDRDFNFSSCIHCGQCVLVCPTGALHEKHYLSEVQEQLSKSDVTQGDTVLTTGAIRPCGVSWA